MADTDGGVIGRLGFVLIVVEVMMELPYHSPVFSSLGKRSHTDSSLFNDRELSLPVSPGFKDIPDPVCKLGRIVKA